MTRLVELGVERFLLSSVLRGVLAQRLVRQVCADCAVEGALTSQQVEALALKVPIERRDELKVRWGEGCPKCRHTGLYGRSGVFELLDVQRRVRQLITEGKRRQRDCLRRARRGHGHAARGRDPQARGRHDDLRGSRAIDGGRAVTPRESRADTFAPVERRLIGGFFGAPALPSQRSPWFGAEPNGTPR